MEMLHKGLHVQRLIKKSKLRKQFPLHDKDSQYYIGIGKNTFTDLLKKSEFIDPVDIDRVRSILEMIEAPQEEIDFILPPNQKSNATYIGSFNSEDTETPMKEISPGYYLLTAELVPIHAQAGYLTGYQDQEYIEMLPKYTTTVDKYAKGKYRFFEANGESMDNGDIREAIPDGTVLMCREIHKQYWKSKLHTHAWPNYIVVHKTEGIVVKQIAKQDLEKGTLILHSLNPDREKYPDFEVNLDDVMELYNVVKRIL